MIEIINLNYKNRKKDILKNINFCIEDGENLAILGENGSGKTTFLKFC